MPKTNIDILVVEKLGNLKIQSIKEFDQENLYKKCGFKNDNNFNLIHTWNVEINEIKFLKLFGKTKGKANFENKYEFPDPVNDLIFGNSLLVGFDTSQKCISINLEDWDNAILQINKGFDTLKDSNCDDEEEEDELAEMDPSQLTKEGYLKDDFIADSSEDEEEIDFIEGEIMEEEYQY